MIGWEKSKCYKNNWVIFFPHQLGGKKTVYKNFFNFEFIILL